MWEIDNLSQLFGFLYSAALGGVCCLVYDALRALRAEIKFGTVSVFVSDILYSLFCAVTCFCFLLSVTAGQPRAFVFVGAAAGFVISRLTVSRLFFFIFSRLLRAARSALLWISSVLSRFFAVIGARTGRLIKKVQKICILPSNTLKKYLKKK